MFESLQLIILLKNFSVTVGIKEAVARTRVGFLLLSMVSELLVLVLIQMKQFMKYEIDVIILKITHITCYAHVFCIIVTRIHIIQ